MQTEEREPKGGGVESKVSKEIENPRGQTLTPLY
jgi:hypothetical protein